jgi:hypothetical protein
MSSFARWILTGLLLALSASLTACQSEPQVAWEPEPTLGPASEPVPETPSDAPDTSPVPTEPEPSHPKEPPPLSAPSEEPTSISEEFLPTLPNRFGFMPAFLDFQSARESGAAYDRPYFELFQWGMIEKEPGFFDFFETDDYVHNAQSAGMHILANIQPFAHWDQAKCHRDLIPPDQSGDPRFATTKGKPCDLEDYKEFVIRLVERYDGDGIDDMPGLTFPIKHWEVMNEPEFNTGTLIFFQGDAADYFEILQATHEAVKYADRGAYVVQGGMAGMMDICTDFWQEVFDLGGAEYLDIMNMHSIGHGEHLNIPVFKRFLEQNEIRGQPLWVTEVQYQQSHQTQYFNNEDYAKILSRSYIFALANGVDKLFYVNIKMPPVFGGEGPPFDERSALIKDNGGKSALFYAHFTIAGLLGDMSEDDTVEIIREEIGDWFIQEAQYRFVINGRTIYALWGSGPLPAEITGEVQVIDIAGVEKIIDAASVALSDSPIFIVMD